jgi:hypothetical protein
MSRDPNDDGLNESQPAGCIPDFEMSTTSLAATWSRV